MNDAINHCDVRSVAAVESTPDVKIYPLQFVGVNIAGYECIALDDSGTLFDISNVSFHSFLDRDRWTSADGDSATSEGV